MFLSVFLALNLKTNQKDYTLLNMRNPLMQFNIFLKTDDLISNFDLKNKEEVVSDGVGKIRVYIFQKTNDNNEKEYFLIRFGKKALENPIQLQYS